MTTTARGFLGSGDIYLELFLAGVSQGLTGPFEADKFEIKANGDLKERVSKGKGKYGNVTASAAVPKPFDVNLTLGEADKAGLAIALRGTGVNVSQTAGSLTAVDVTAALDKWVTLTKANLTGSATVTNTGASTTYVEGTDYEINREIGMFKALSTGTITDAQALKLTSTHGAITENQIRGGTVSSIIARVLFDGVNLADGQPAIVDIYQAVFASDAAVDFLSDSFVTVPLKGRLVTPAGKSEPFLIKQRTVG